jgi:antitoxin component YwqK of YwqJK toxin-antitoxin module
MNLPTICIIKKAPWIGAFLFCLIWGTALGQTTKKELVKTYHNNGKLYEKGKLINSQKVGTWLYYHPDGWLEKRIKYRNNQAVWQIYFDAQHKKVRVIDKHGKDVPFRGCNCKN